MKAGFIGLGTLGRPMVENLIDRGVEMTVWNRTRARADGLAATIAESPAAVVAAAPATFVMVRDSDAADAVLNGPGGVFSADCAGKLIIDTTTHNAGRVVAFHEQAAAHGCAYVEAPVLGSVVPGRRGELVVYASGTDDALARARPLLDLVSRRVEHLGGPGQATRMKLINNFVLGVFVTALAEAIHLGEAAGFERERVIELLGNGSGKSLVLDAKKDKFLSEDYTTHFSIANLIKDLHYAQDLAWNLERPLFTAGVVEDVLSLAMLDGRGDLDFAAIYDLLKRS